jgi:cell wall-associated NlpC family hydrolase
VNDCISNAQDITKYIGIPYKRGESSSAGCDCWGLVRLFYHRELGINLPNYKDFAVIDRNLFRPIAEPALHSIALIAHDGATISHCGLFTAAGLLHSLENTGVLLSRVELWKPKIVGCYEYTAFSSI